MLKKTNSESLIKASIAILIAQAIFLIANFLYHFLSARLLGPAEYATVASIFSIFYLVTVGSSAIQNTATKYVSGFKAKKDYKKISLFFKRGFRKIFLVSLFLFAVYLAISPLIASFLNIPLIAVLISSPAIILFALVPFNRGILQGLQKFGSLGINLIAEGLIRLALALALIFLGLKSNGALAAVSIATLVAVLITFPSLKLEKAKGKINIDRKGLYRFVFISFIALFLVNAIYNMDVFLVKHFFSAEQAGHYAAISLLGKIVFFGATAIGLVMFPKVSEMHLNDRKKAGSIFMKALGFTLIISALITAVYFLFPNLIVSLLFGSEYESIIPLIGFFGIFMTFLSLSYICVLNKLALGRKKFIIILGIAAIAEIALISLFHSSLQQIVTILIILNAFLFISLLKQ
jgi:O-antigen/teichoic acid export membrane protein